MRPILPSILTSSRINIPTLAILAAMSLFFGVPASCIADNSMKPKNRNKQVNANAKNSKDSEEPCWFIKHKHPMYGENLLYLTKKGMRVENPLFGYVWVRKENDKNFYIFNPQKRNYFTSQGIAELGRAEMVAILTTRDLEGMNWSKAKLKPSGTATIAGIPTVKYVFKGQKKWEFWVTQHFGVPLWEYEDNCEWSKIPQFHALPMRIIITLQNGEKRSMLDTLAVKKTTIPLSKLALPAGLKRTQNIAEVSDHDIDSVSKDMSLILGW